MEKITAPRPLSHATVAVGTAAAAVGVLGGGLLTASMLHQQGVDEAHSLVCGGEDALGEDLLELDANLVSPPDESAPRGRIVRSLRKASRAAAGKLPFFGSKSSDSITEACNRVQPNYPPASVKPIAIFSQRQPSNDGGRKSLEQPKLQTTTKHGSVPTTHNGKERRTNTSAKVSTTMQRNVKVESRRRTSPLSSSPNNSAAQWRTRAEANPHMKIFLQSVPCQWFDSSTNLAPTQGRPRRASVAQSSQSSGRTSTVVTDTEAENETPQVEKILAKLPGPPPLDERISQWVNANQKATRTTLKSRMRIGSAKG